VIKQYFAYILLLNIAIYFAGCNANNSNPNIIPINYHNKIKSNIALDKEIKSNIALDNKIKDITEDVVELDTTINTIAIVFPSKVIGKYAIDATNSAMSYLLYKKNTFQLKVFDTVDENKQSIEKVFNKIEKEGISKILVLFTYNGAKYLKDVKNINKYDIYLPLIDKSILNLDLNNAIYGSINYAEQFELLLKYSSDKISNFYDNSKLGATLFNAVNTKTNKQIYTKRINNNNGQYKKFLTIENKKLLDSTLIVNMPIVKSSIILSQVYANDVNLTNILSTQLNYTPLLLSLTQIEDRSNMIIANSIDKINNVVEENNALLDTDIVYNWVNYSTTIGIEYLISKDISSFVSITLENDQIKYPVKLYTTTKYSFQPLN